MATKPPTRFENPVARISTIRILCGGISPTAAAFVLEVACVGQTLGFFYPTLAYLQTNIPKRYVRYVSRYIEMYLGCIWTRFFIRRKKWKRHILKISASSTMHLTFHTPWTFPRHVCTPRTTHHTTRRWLPVDSRWCQCLAPGQLARLDVIHLYQVKTTFILRRSNFGHHL